MTQDPNNPGLGRSIGEIVERMTTLIHEEIELAKAEMAEAVTNIVRGSVAAILGGAFGVFGLMMLLEGLSWFISDALDDIAWIGFFIVAAICFMLGGFAAGIALNKLRAGSQLAPEQAIEEARRTQQALRSDGPLIGARYQEFEGEAVEVTSGVTSGEVQQ